MIYEKWLLHGLGVTTTALIKWEKTDDPNKIIIKRIDTGFRSGGKLYFSYIEQKESKSGFDKDFLEHSREAESSFLHSMLAHLFMSTEFKVNIE
jgi:hypothetical protein